MQQDPQFKPSDNFTEKALSEMTGTYLRNMVGTGMIAIALPNLVWLVQKILRIGFNPFFLIAILLLWGVGILGVIRIILAIGISGKIRLGQFTWRQGKITGYKNEKREGTKNRFFTMVDDTYYCSLFASPIYKKGADVYYIRIHADDFEQDIVIGF
jgi:hypothetical protein